MKAVTTLYYFAINISIYQFQTIAGQIKLEMIDDKWDELQAEILGPDNTPYAGGRFKLKIKIPTKYPFKAPEVQNDF